jgi:hypothetical protein
MRFIRKKFFIRTFSFFLIIVLVNSIFYPSISYALTTGPHQPEFTSYEDAGASDMVNLLTGDFNLSMPILSVPVGSEGAFPIPLSYHAGGSPEQEASWTGLGWNINIGSLTRSIEGFPDDAKGDETQTIQVKDLTGRRGWSSNFLGSHFGWDSQVGHYGTIATTGYAPGASISYNNVGITSHEVLGFTMSKNGKANFDGAKFTSDVIEMVMAAATYGTSSWAESAINVAMDVGISLTMESVMPNNMPSPQTAGAWEYTRTPEKHLFYTDYWVWLDQTRTEQMFGTLYLDKATSTVFPDPSPAWLKVRKSVNGSGLQTVDKFIKSQPNVGAASDISIDLSSTTNYEDNVSPTMLATDNFSVKGPGISGSIKPYRLEVGSVSVPREMTTYHTRLNPVPFIDYATNKVPFVYEGSIASSYFHHVGGSTAVTSPTFNFGVDLSLSGTDVLQYSLNDIIFNNERIRSNISANKKLPQGHYIDWLTNGEIKNTTNGFVGSSYVDYFSGTARNNFRSVYSAGGRRAFSASTYSTYVLQFAQSEDLNFNIGDKADIIMTEYYDEDMALVVGTHNYVDVTVNSVDRPNHRITVDATVDYGPYCTIQIISKTNNPKPDHSIGGFVITSPDGMNYHYSIPVYDYDFKTETIDKSDASKKSTITRSSPIANTWLLTAITGPDFIDRGGANNGSNGVIDNNDWGYWVKFNYGRHSSDFKWRLPYSTANDTYKMTSDDLYKVYAQGTKEKYYLNSIETRSHVALFIKDTRNDAKDASVNRQGSLRLGEIALLTRDAYNQLTDPNDVYKLRNGSGVIDFLYRYSGSSFTDGNVSGNKLTFIQSNCLKRIVFNHDYSLCLNPDNSDSGFGKLTLKSVSVLGRNSAKIFPDYKFTYDSNNPNYNRDKWDGWDMYSSSGTSAGNTHQASTSSSDASIWNLTSLTSPLGNVTSISYERDTYASISDKIVYGLGAPYSASYSTTYYYAGDGSLNELRISNANQLFKTGDKVYVQGNVDFSCAGSFPPTYTYTANGSASLAYSGEYTVLSTTSTSIVLNGNYMGITYCNQGSVVNIQNSGTIRKQVSKNGGNTRVKAITLNDSWGQQYKTRYIYDDEYGMSTGVVSVEPDYIRVTDSDYAFYKWLGYPATPVIYGKVTVLTGKLTTDTEYHTKEVFAFETPKLGQYQINTLKIKDKVQLASLDYATVIKHEIVNKTNQIGKLNSIKKYDKNGNLFSSQDFSYSETPLNDGVNNYQGIFSEGTLMFEIFTKAANPLLKNYHKGQRTTVLNYPYTLQKVTTTTDGFTSTSENKNWDFNTGLVLETTDKSPLGLTVKTIIEPAYKNYPELGSKAINSSNKNMLTQIVASYSYRLDDKGNELGLIGGSATTWGKDWQYYRTLQGSNYANSNDIYDLNNDNVISPIETAAQQVWRKSESYIWIGDNTKLNPFGVHYFASNEKFSFSGSNSSKWKKAGSFERFNHNSVVLETKDLNGKYASTKFGYNNLLSIATAANAKFEEIAFSGAEDKLVSTPTFFGGEVAIGSASNVVVTTPVHTGKFALSVPATNTGFVFKSSGNNGVSIRKYRASVWTTDATNGRIYYKVNGTESVPTPAISQAIILPNGSTWYRLDISFDVNVTSPSFEIGVKSLSGTVVFDDFRFQPFESVMTCYVYNPGTMDLEYVLGNDNTYTRYEYNDRGFATKTYIESMMKDKTGERLTKEVKDDFRRFYE